MSRPANGAFFALHFPTSAAHSQVTRKLRARRMPGRYGVAVSKTSGLYFSPEKTFASGEYSIVPCCQRKQFYAHSCCEFDGSTASSDARKSGTPQCLSGARSVTWALRSSRQSRPRQGDSGVADAQAGQEHKTQEVHDYTCKPCTSFIDAC